MSIIGKLGGFAVTITMLATLSGSASAALSSNGLTTNNALSSNALSSNALSSNALSSNALSSNALSSNALSSNALTANGLAPANAWKLSGIDTDKPLSVSIKAARK